MTNLHACLVHESPECVADLVANLRHLDPDSAILLYDGSKNHQLLSSGVMPGGEGIFVHPAPRPMRWGRLHDFAFDCLRMALDVLDFSTITIVDSDQLAIRPGYSAYLESQLAEALDLGALVSEGGGPQSRATRNDVARAAWREFDLWRPFLRRFRHGEQHFPQWTFWPSTVFTRAAALGLVDFADDPQLKALLGRSRLWATEEVVLPTLVALLGLEVRRSPCSTDLVRFRVPWTPTQVARGMQRENVFWLHPVPRRLDDPLRSWVRSRYGEYAPLDPSDDAESAPRSKPQELVTPPAPKSDLTVPEHAAAPKPLQPMQVLDRMQQIPGPWSRAEGDLLLGAAVGALNATTPPRTIVGLADTSGQSAAVLGAVVQALAPEAKVYAIARDDSTVDSVLTAADAAGVRDPVRLVRRDSLAGWNQPISMLLLGGESGFASLAIDYSQFESSLMPGAVVAFHGCTPRSKGIGPFVDHAVRAGALAPALLTDTLGVFRFACPLGVGALREVLAEMDAVEGWLSEDEAAFLGLLAAESTRLDPAATIVEIGSYCGRGTVVLARVASASPGAQVYAVDTFDGTVGAIGQDLTHGEPTLARFQATIARTGLTHRVNVLRGRSREVPWDGPISLLVVDGLHDYPSVRADFDRFAPHVAPGGTVAFHDFADYYPGVRAIVERVAASPEWDGLEIVGTMARLRRVAEPARAQVSPAEMSPAEVVPAEVVPAEVVHVEERIRSAVPVQPVDVPLVSCIMPTFSRRWIVPQALRYFLRQDHAACELIVVDDGPEPVEDLLPDDWRIRYLRLDRRRTIGAKRNLACEMASGDFIAHWDDDDWFAPSRLRVQLATLHAEDRAVTGLDTFKYWEPSAQRAWTYQYPEQANRPWAHDPTLLFHRSVWERHPYPNVSHGLDARWLWGRVREAPVIGHGVDLYVGLVHSSNTSLKQTANTWWHPCSVEDVRNAVGTDVSFYEKSGTE